MKGTHLGRVARSQPGTGFSIPLEGVQLETLGLDGPQDEGRVDEERFYLALEGEVVLDLEHGQFIHLRRLEGTTVAAGAWRRLSPVGEAVVLRVSVAR